MTRKSPFPIAAILLISLLWLVTGGALAQPGEPGGPPGSDGPPEGQPPWAGGPPPWAGPPEEPGPSPTRGSGDDEEDGEDENDIPAFCSAAGARNGPDGQAGLSSIAHLDFSQQDPDTGEPLEDGSWGRIMYRWMAPVFDYVFNGHELPPGDDYTLTYQPQPLPSPGVICLGTGTVNDEGDLHLQDAFDIETDLPADYDENEDEAILALVIASDVDCELGEMTNWDPDNYLFGDEGMFYVHSELDDEEDDEEDGEG